MIGAGGELALVDVREELIFSQRHLLLARSIPLSRFELKFAQLVPRRSTRVVLCDDNDGLAERAAAVLMRNGYPDTFVLNGGVDAWVAAGFEVFSGVNVPSKAFGEYIEHKNGTPNISAHELEKLIRDKANIVVLDSRPFDEYSRVSIPTGINVPGAELVLRAREIAPVARDHGRCELRRPDAQHHRRAIADQRRPAEQSRGAAQRDHGLQPRGLRLR